MAMSFTEMAKEGIYGGRNQWFCFSQIKLEMPVEH